MRYFCYAHGQSLTLYFHLKMAIDMARTEEQNIPYLRNANKLSRQEVDSVPPSQMRWDKRQHGMGLGDGHGLLQRPPQGLRQGPGTCCLRSGTRTGLRLTSARSSSPILSFRSHSGLQVIIPSTKIPQKPLKNPHETHLVFKQIHLLVCISFRRGFDYTHSLLKKFLEKPI